jgi:hypothetical protein
MMEENKIYFASPWFTPEQEEREERLKAKLRSLGFEVHSPKEEAVCGAISDQETREKIFMGNIWAINDCDIVFVVTDGKDMGTIWEAGYAYGYNERQRAVGYEPKKIVYYCETLGNGLFNLMLAQSGDIVITEFEGVDKLPELLAGGEKVAYAGRIQ